MPGLLDDFDLNSPAAQGLLAAAFGGLAGARRGQPVNSIGRAGLAGLGGYADAQDRQFQQQDRATQRQMTALQLKKATRDDATETGLLGLQPQFFTPGQAANPGTAGVNELMTPDMRVGAPMPATPATAPKFDVNGYTSTALSKGLMTPIQAAQLNSAMAKDTPFNKLDVKDFTPESVRTFVASGGRDHSLLQPRTKMEVAPNGVAYDAYNVKPGTVFGDPNKPFSVNPQGGFLPNEPYQSFELKKAKVGAPNVNTTVSVAGPENRYNADIGAGLAKDDLAAVDSAKAAPKAIANAQSIREAIASGAFTGTAAEKRLGLQKAFETAGLVKPGDAAATEKLVSGLASVTLDNVKISGLGAGQGFTDKDREFVQDAKSGRIEMTRENILRVAELNEKAARASYERGQKVVQRWQGNPSLKNFSQNAQLDALPEPGATAPKAPAMAAMPPANASNKDRVIRDTATGKTYRSDGISWKAQ